MSVRVIRLRRLTLLLCEDRVAIRGRVCVEECENPAHAGSSRPYRGLDELTYPFHDATFTVTQCGRICLKGRKVNLSHVFAGHNGSSVRRRTPATNLPRRRGIQPHDGPVVGRSDASC